MAIATPTSPVLPNDRIGPMARKSGQRLARFADRDLDVKIAGTDETLTLPAEAVRLLVDLLDQLAQGNAVTIVPYHAELTTQQAADFLGVSRPFLVQQLEEGAIAYRKVGTHRRVAFKDLVTYKQSMRSKRLAALEELSALDQELGLR